MSTKVVQVINQIYSLKKLDHNKYYTIKAMLEYPYQDSERTIPSKNNKIVAWKVSRSNFPAIFLHWFYQIENSKTELCPK